MPNHDSAISALSFSPDESQLLSVGGHTAVLWDVKTRKMIRQVRGPQDLTAGLILPDGKAAFFATRYGHVLRWDLSKSEAEEVKGFGCRANLVPPERQRLDPAKRCVSGFYELHGDQPICFYPVTQLVRRGDQVARACLEGTVGIMDLATRRVRWSNIAGVLGSLTFVGQDLLLFGRRDGELRLWQIAEKKVAGSLIPGVRSTASASDGTLVAVASPKKIRIWRKGQPQVAGAVTVPRPVVWLSLKQGELRALLDDGRLVSHPLKVE